MKINKSHITKKNGKFDDLTAKEIATKEGFSEIVNLFLGLEDKNNNDTLPAVPQDILKTESQRDEIESNRFITQYESIMCKSISPYIVLRHPETPCSFKESLIIGFEGLDDEQEQLLDKNIYQATRNYTYLEDNFGLTLEEYFSVYFYTLEWSSTLTQSRNQRNLYSRLNSDLTDPRRETKAPKWRFYLFYLFNAIRKIPIWTGRQDLYRGVRDNLCKKYPDKYIQGNTITWYAFTSTTTKLTRVSSFLAALTPNEPCTIFTINCAISGRLIQSLSATPTEAEVLLPPGSRFYVVGIVPAGSAVMIQLEQIPSLEKELKLEK